MARTNAFSRGSLIALVSDTARDTGMVQRFAAFTAYVERVGLDVAAPTLIATLMRQVADLERKLAVAERASQELGAQVAGWDADDMAISAASAVERKATPVSLVKDTAVSLDWLTYGRKNVLLRCANDLGVAFDEIVAAIVGAMKAGHTAQDATGAWVARNGGGDWTDARRAAAVAMRFPSA